MSSSSSDGASSSSSSSSSGSNNARAGDTEPKKQKVEEVEKTSKKQELVVSSVSGSESGSSSESSDKKKKKKAKKKKDKKKDKKKKKKKNKDGKKKKKKKVNKDDDKKKANRAKKKAKRMKKANRDSVSTQFGKYGIIKAEDFYNKKPEFLSWAMEVRKEKNLDSMGQMDMKNLFKEFIEDYNTATMPSKKYYNLQTWDTTMSKKRQQRNRGDDMSDAQKAAFTSFDDEKARREELRHLQAKKQEDLITNEVRKMRTDKGKVSEMNHQENLKTQMDILSKTGRTAEAQKIKDRMNPALDEFGRPARPS